jgi:hypothetical protein
MMSVLMLMLWILPTAHNHPKGGLLRTIYLLMDQQYFYCRMLKLVVNMRLYCGSNQEDFSFQ